MGSTSTGGERGLELDQDLDFQETEWKTERIAWGVMLMIIILAVLGLFGTGVLSSAVARSENDALTVDYERFVRHDGEASLEIEVDPRQVTGGQVEVWLPAGYINEIQIEHISPEPDEVRAEGDRQVYVFLSDAPNAPLSISFSFSPDTMGRYEGEVGIVDGPSVTFAQFSYP